MAVVSLVFYKWGVASGWHTRYLEEVEHVHDDAPARAGKQAPSGVPQGA